MAHPTGFEPHCKLNKIKGLIHITMMVLYQFL